MKKLLFVLAVFMVGCSSDDAENETITKEDLKGTWHLSSYAIDGDNITLDECDLKEHISFDESEITFTSAYWQDSFLEENCTTSNSSRRFKLENGSLKIENNYLDVNYYAYIKYTGEIEITYFVNDLKVEKIFSKN